MICYQKYTSNNKKTPNKTHLRTNLLHVARSVATIRDEAFLMVATLENDFWTFPSQSRSCLTLIQWHQSEIIEAKNSICPRNCWSFCMESDLYKGARGMRTLMNGLYIYNSTYSYALNHETYLLHATHVRLKKDRKRKETHAHTYYYIYYWYNMHTKTHRKLAAITCGRQNMHHCNKNSIVVTPSL